ncbi:MAG: hypothetical protein ACRD9L_24640, partial [Bryobacteraceae bacterium]
RYTFRRGTYFMFRRRRWLEERIMIYSQGSVGWTCGAPMAMKVSSNCDTWMPAWAVEVVTALEQSRPKGV